MVDLQDDYKMSDQELAAQLRQSHEVQQVRDYKFPTEIIELPSNGFRKKPRAIERFFSTTHHCS